MLKKFVKRNKKGQSTLEYIILVTGVIAIIIVFAGPGGLFSQSLNRTLGQGTNGMEDMSNRLRNSRP
ncbi:MAG: hypothetical protein A2787_05515 [Omnitrophica WOR_2 bacterium RIFCSPHIGHO2_01_FULL_48_9]|nr:MAG: hypothetical protein A3D10_06260 [Omnitrophica WOR_2 bacterium RIFCSPHIGHO2_02_FULL_48_11]OGX32837.1 MAG: hypothetical protein A2787_05515 [Omnitrophica WOR_2 bacterium RIFCSPHIGHO2_01_FULL_48_9]